MCLNLMVQLSLWLMQFLLSFVCDKSPNFYSCEALNGKFFVFLFFCCCCCCFFGIVTCSRHLCLHYLASLSLTVSVFSHLQIYSPSHYLTYLLGHLLCWRVWKRMQGAHLWNAGNVKAWVPWTSHLPHEHGMNPVKTKKARSPVT